MHRYHIRSNFFAPTLISFFQARRRKDPMASSKDQKAPAQQCQDGNSRPVISASLSDPEKTPRMVDAQSLYTVYRNCISCGCNRFTDAEWDAARNSIFVEMFVKKTDVYKKIAASGVEFGDFRIGSSALYCHQCPDRLVSEDLFHMYDAKRAGAATV